MFLRHYSKSPGYIVLCKIVFVYSTLVTACMFVVFMYKINGRCPETKSTGVPRDQFNQIANKSLNVSVSPKHFKCLA